MKSYVTLDIMEIWDKINLQCNVTCNIICLFQVKMFWDVFVLYIFKKPVLFHVEA